MPDRAPELGARSVTTAPPSILVVAQAWFGLLVVRMIVVPPVAVRLDPPPIDQRVDAEIEVKIAVQAMKAGAVDFVEKPFRRQQILDSLTLARQHLSALETGDENGEAARSRLARLSARESEVLNGLVAGLPNKTIRPRP